MLKYPLSKAQWLEKVLPFLADKVIKPTIAPDKDPRVTTLPFYGFDPSEVIKPV